MEEDAEPEVMDADLIGAAQHVGTTKSQGTAVSVLTPNYWDSTKSPAYFKKP
jgi:hypothetical protein